MVCAGICHKAWNVREIRTLGAPPRTLERYLDGRYRPEDVVQLATALGFARMLRGRTNWLLLSNTVETTISRPHLPPWIIVPDFALVRKLQSSLRSCPTQHLSSPIQARKCPDRERKPGWPQQRPFFPRILLCELERRLQLHCSSPPQSHCSMPVTVGIYNTATHPTLQLLSPSSSSTG